MPAQNDQTAQNPQANPMASADRPDEQNPGAGNPLPKPNASQGVRPSGALRPMESTSQDNGPRATPDEALGADPTDDISGADPADEPQVGPQMNAEGQALGAAPYAPYDEVVHEGPGERRDAPRQADRSGRAIAQDAADHLGELVDPNRAEVSMDKPASPGRSATHVNDANDTRNTNTAQLTADLVDPTRDAPNLDALSDAIDDSALDDIDLDPLQTPTDTNVIDAVGDYEPDLLTEPEPDPAFFAPVDPVLTADTSGDAEVLNGFSPTAMDGEHVDRSVEDNIPGDEALADAVRAALRADAATTDLDVRVQVARGVARLRGQVASLEDAENAEAVAADVPGVNDVIEEIDVDGM